MAANKSPLVKCPVCEGKGEYDVIQSYGGEDTKLTIECYACLGKGKITRAQAAHMRLSKSLSTGGRK